MADKKQSSTILNILLILFGALFLIQGVVGVLASYGIMMPPWLLTGLAATAEAQALLGGAAYMTTALGIWALIAGIALFFEEEWALGQSLVILSLIAINSIVATVAEFMSAPIAWGTAILWINLIAAILSVVGFVYLLITSKRYH